MSRTAEYRAAVPQAVDRGGNTDWQKAIGRTAVQQRNSLSVSGGSGSFNYLGGIDYQNQQGIVINSHFKRGTIRFNFDKTISPKFRMGLASQFAFSNENDALVNTNGGASGGVMYDALRFNPATPISIPSIKTEKNSTLPCP